MTTRARGHHSPTGAPTIPDLVRDDVLPAVKTAAAGRWSEILSQVGGVDLALLDGRNHPCVKCGGKDRFRMIDSKAGALFCNQCFNKRNGDGLAAIQWLLNCDFPTALDHVAKYLGVSRNGNGDHRPDLLTLVCRQKRMPIESARAYGAYQAKRRKLDVIRFPIVNEHGEIHSHFDLPGGDGKGWFRAKTPSGLFLPIENGKPRLPAAGETWIQCEGVKDAAAYHGLGYLACGLPTDNMNVKYARLFAGCHVIVIPDRMVDAEAKAQKTGARLHGKAASVRIGTLPLEIGGDADDARDVLATRGGEDLLRQAITDAVEFRPPQPEPGELSLMVPEGRTEAANARRLVKKFHESMRWVEPWQKWLTWDGQRWAIDDQRQSDANAKQIGRELWQEFGIKAQLAGNELISSMSSFCRASNAANGIRNMLALARSEPGIPVRPAMLDSDPWLLNVANGTIDLRSSERQPHTFRPHDRGDFITKVCPVEYLPDATCPLWLDFLDKIMAGSGELITYLQRLAGYCLTGETSEHILPFLYGHGANGKTTFLNTVMAMIGEDYAIKAASDLLLAKKGSHPTELTDLHGRRLAACVEVQDGRRMAEGLVKELTGSDSVRARRMREDFWQFKPTHKIWLAANHKPVIRGTDYGMWRRVKLIPFTVTIPEAEQDKRLPEKLLAELPGILNWALAGCDQWQHEGLGEPAEVTEATAGYKAQSDDVGRFIDECCLTGDRYEAGASDLYKAFKDWGGTMTQTRFGDELGNRGYVDDRYTSGPKKGRKHRLGIGLVSDGWLDENADG